MRVGIAGYGVVGKTRHASIKKNTSYEVVAISEANSQAQRNIPSNIDIYHDYHDLIFKADLDIIFISLPNKFASDAVSLSLKNGLNVFCEKPPARNLDELIQVNEIYKKCGFMNNNYFDSRNIWSLDNKSFYTIYSTFSNPSRNNFCTK